MKEFSEIEFSVHLFPVYRVVIDPGHGGLSLLPTQKHGDRYDLISKKYLSTYYEGASYKKLEEKVIVYNIAKKVKDILDLTLKKNTFEELKLILNKFSNDEPDRIIIRTFLSRGESLKSNMRISEDPNSEYRLFNFVDKHGKNRDGRISYINKLRPHLVIALHCDFQAPIYYRGINPVISAPYSLFIKGLEYLQGKREKRDFFFKSPYRDWFPESVKRTGFKWFLKDTAAYFSGYPVTNKLKIQHNKFSGYRYNMVTWKYRDPDGWERSAAKHNDNTQYSKNLRKFIPKGKFWERERSVHESYRRDGGIEGFGGDNLYACTEIIRYILFSLYQSGNHYKTQRLGNPYISIWSLPILVNAITAYIELGYLKRKRDRYLLAKRQDEIAEGIAAGIYSLFAGLKPYKKKFKYLPKGRKLDLKKYIFPDGKSYFDVVSSFVH